MQADVITLAVDEDNSGEGTNNHVFNRFEEWQNRSVYIGPNHTLGTRNTIGLYRTFPKASGNFKGVAKPSIKYTKDVLVTGVDGVSQLTAPIIFDLSMSVPVGATSSDLLIAQMVFKALLARQDVMASLIEQGMI